MRRTTIFTTHTPVPAGHDAFPFDLVETHLAGLLGHARRLPRRASSRSAHYDNGSGPQFNMTALALRDGRRRQRASASCTARSRARCGRRSGRASPEDQRPVRAITNGIHVPTWLSHEMTRAVRRVSAGRIGASATTIRPSGSACSTFRTRSCGRRAARCGSISSRSSASARAQRWTRGTRQRGAGRRRRARCSIPNALTIGFARRFTGYKRPELIFRDPDRLHADPERAAPAGADRVRGQGASGRRNRQAPPAAGLSPARSIRCSAAASPSWTTTTCTSRTSWCRAATSG